MLILGMAACASLPRPSDAPEPQPPVAADEAKADNCANQSDHGIACAIGTAIERAGSMRK